MHYWQIYKFYLLVLWMNEKLKCMVNNAKRDESENYITLFDTLSSSLL